MTVCVVIDFAEGADPEAVKMLADQLTEWALGPALMYGARLPRIEGGAPEGRSHSSKEDDDGSVMG